MLKKALFVLALTAVPTAAFAQDEGGTGDGDGSATTTETENTGGTVSDAANGAMTAQGSGPAVFKHGTMGIWFPVTSLITINLGTGTSTTVPTANLIWFNDANNALDLMLGAELAVTPDGVDNMGNPVAGATTFGIGLGLGYRMYKHHSERVHTFLEPFVKINVPDVSSFADVLGLGVGAQMGAEVMFTEWFSVGGSIGAAANFSDKFKSIDVATFTSGLSANIYWD